MNTPATNAQLESAASALGVVSLIGLAFLAITIICLIGV